jgi:hypothetical protein
MCRSKAAACVVLLALAGVLAGSCGLSTSAITVEGTVEHLVASAEVVSIKEVTAVPPGGDFRREVVLSGALLRLRSTSGRVYFVKVLPQCLVVGRGLAIKLDEGWSAVANKRRGVRVDIAHYIGQAPLFVSKEMRDGREWTIVDGLQQGNDWVVLADVGAQMPVVSNGVYTVKGYLRERAVFMSGPKPVLASTLATDAQFVEAVELTRLR